MKTTHTLTAFALVTSFLLPTAHADGISALTPAGNQLIAKEHGEQEAARRYTEEIVANRTNADIRAQMLEMILAQKKAKQHRSLSRTDFTLVVNVGLGWNDAQGPETPTYVHEFVDDMRSLGVPVVFMQKDPYGHIGDNAKTIAPQLEQVLAGDRPVVILTLCKGTPEMVGALDQVLSLDASRRQTGGAHIAAYLNLSGMLTGTFYSDVFSDSRLVGLLGKRMMRSKDEMTIEWGKTALATPHMRSAVIEGYLQDRLLGLPTDAFYLNVVGAPTDRALLKNETPLAPFIRLNDWFRFFTAANDGYLDVTRIALPRWAAPHQGTITLNASHLLTDGWFGEHLLTDQFTRRAFYRALFETAIQRGSWDSAR